MRRRHVPRPSRRTPGATATLTDIVPLADEHLPAVAALFQKTFRDGRKPPPPDLAADLRALFLDHPERDTAIPSRVWLKADGSAGGFIGAVPLRMRFRGRTIRAAVPSSLMVEAPAAHPLAGARLVRAFLSGPQDLSISEPINERAQGLWRKLGGEVPVAESMEWLKVLKPAGLALALAADRYPMLFRLRGAAALADRLAPRFAEGRLALPAPDRRLAGDADVSDADLLAFLAGDAADYTLHPDWAPPTFGWMLAHAAGNRSRGRLVKRMAYGPKGDALGAYVYQGAPGRIAFVLHFQARRETAGAVLDALFTHAAKAGCVAVKGRTQERLIGPLLARGAALFRRHGMMVHSRDRELLAAIHAGEAATGGLAGESWMRPVAARGA